MRKRRPPTTLSCSPINVTEPLLNASLWRKMNDKAQLRTLCAPWAGFSPLRGRMASAILARFVRHGRPRRNGQPKGDLAMHSSYNSLLEYNTVRPSHRNTYLVSVSSRTIAAHPTMAAFLPCQERWRVIVGLYQQPLAAWFGHHVCARNPAPPWWPTCLGAPNAGLPPVHGAQPCATPAGA